MQYHCKQSVDAFWTVYTLLIILNEIALFDSPVVIINVMPSARLTWNKIKYNKWFSQCLFYLIFFHMCRRPHIWKLEGKYSLESTYPHKSKIRTPPQLTTALKLSYYLFIIAKLFKVKDLPKVCLQYKNPRFTAFLGSNLHTRLAIVTENELGLAFSPRNLPKKFRPDPSTFYLVIVVTNKQTDRQTNAGKNNPSLSRG